MKQVTKVMLVSVVINIFLAIMKVLGGFFCSSRALIADGIHSFSDLTTDFFAIIGNALSQKPADKKHPYGHGKIEYVTSILIGFLILFVGFRVIYDSSKSTASFPSVWVCAISLCAIILKLFLSSYIISQGKSLKNNILIASGKESRSDVISSFIVFLSSLLVQLSPWIPILKYSDKIASILVGLLIVRIGFFVVKENMSILLGEQETDEVYLNKLKEVILSEKGIYHIQSLILLKFGHLYKVTLTVGMDGNMKLKSAHKIVDQLEEKMKEFDSKIGYVTVHMEPIEKEMKK